MEPCEKGTSDPPMSTGVTNEEGPLESVKKVSVSSPRESRAGKQAGRQAGKAQARILKFPFQEVFFLFNFSSVHRVPFSASRLTLSRSAYFPSYSPPRVLPFVFRLKITHDPAERQSDHNLRMIKFPSFVLCSVNRVRPASDIPLVSFRFVPSRPIISSMLEAIVGDARG